jgi:hypothetical protein
MKHAFSSIISILFIVLATCSQMYPQIAFASNDVVIARGNGIVSVSGTGNAELKCSGYIIVTNKPAVEIIGDKGTMIDLDENTSLYINFNGTMVVSGDDMEVECGGANIVLRSRIDGVVFLSGSGYYRRGMKTFFWDADGVTLD